MPKIAKANNQTHIHLKGAKVHNLKNIELLIPKNKLVVITGLSGSGKSSLAFDTLYAEGQRRYIESLSSYARQFLGKLEKPEVDFIKGISPAIAIEQKVTSKNPRSTVGTSTEIYDYVKLLFARIGKTISPVSGEEVKKSTTEDVLNYTKTFKEGAKLLILAPYSVADETELNKYLKNLKQEGVNRIKIDETVSKIDDVINETPSKYEKLSIVIDRVVYKANDDENDSRLF